MELTDRQNKILTTLIKNYIDTPEPISSELLKKKCGLDISPATIRNELQDLTNMGYITQPHTSAGRVPTEKGYKYFVGIIFSREEIFPEFIVREIETAKQKIDRELQLAKELAASLQQISFSLEIHHIEEHSLFDLLKIIGPSRTTYDNNIGMMKKLLEEFENF